MSWINPFGKSKEAQDAATAAFSQSITDSRVYALAGGTDPQVEEQFFEERCEAWGEYRQTLPFWKRPPSVETINKQLS